MKHFSVPFLKTGYFSSLITDYLSEKESLKPFYGRYPHIENFAAQIAEKKAYFSNEKRKVLYNAIKEQYKEVTHTEETNKNVENLSLENTFTITTGHQLNLFTGPLYFLYKIVATINLCKELKEAYPKSNFVPIYWMATEDHDFDEINHFKFKGKKIQWNRADGGPVGRFNTEGLDEVLAVFASELGSNTNATQLKEWFKKGYLEHANLTAATRYLVNELFGEYGLVIVDGDHKALKKELVPYIKKDIEESVSFSEVSKKMADLKAVSSEYSIQVNPREINYFYIEDGLRERIILEGDQYKINNTELSFSKEEFWELLDTSPEKFSPNVICRPLYQEVILPNLCYIGGGGELAYWLELKSFFKEIAVPFPMLLLRNSVLIASEKQFGKIEKLEVSIEDVFLKQNTLINKRIRAISNIDIDFSEQKTFLSNQFAEMYALAEKTDVSFKGAVKAQERKQINGLDYLEKRLLQAQKRKLKDHVTRLTEAQNALFPEKSLQERNANFSELYLEYGQDLISILLEEQKPLYGTFTVLVL